MSSDNDIRPRLRDDRIYDFRDALVDAMRNFKGELVKSCITCMYFNERNETCKVANGQRPPARVIAYGCKQYFAPDEIPF